MHLDTTAQFYYRTTHVGPHALTPPPSPPHLFRDLIISFLYEDDGTTAEAAAVRG